MRYYCPNCNSHYNEAEITFNGWHSKWCRFCFKMSESPKDCELIEEDIK